MRVLKKTISAIVLIAVGTILVLPIEAKVSSAGITIKWLSKKYYSKKQANKRYYTKKQSNVRYYTKTQSNSRFYTQIATNTLLTDYLTSSNAASTYLPLTGGTLTGSLSASGYSYSSAKTRYLNIPGSGFRPESDAVINSSNGGNIWIVSGTPTLYADAPINLPDGAIITAARMYYYDNSSSELGILIDRYPINNGTTDRVGAATSTSGTSSSLRTLDLPIDSSLATVDNSSYSYFVSLTFGGTGTSLMFRMLRITYTISEP